ncbi:Ppx/GppA family phosphatase [Metallosphaera tengchongensis]|uniref:Ppx/GppA family phosphatase n=1 Tax=Metallosphaera tengchongensis TaxID=1532350 RepID=A0A6N0NS59_9CREN|nr:Ppx/GppA phosphatase family protein [Metallosphaera tengchongensis]QKQ99024.1 Ppx/GppA family phosphatase [Metallosphaera tengchongensis]
MDEVAVIDLGYNSIRLSLFQRGERNTFRTLGSMKEFTRLGEGVDEGGEIRQEKIEEAERVMIKFRSVLERRGVETVHPLGTSAFRLARNGEEVSKRLSKALGWEIQIVPGEEEGRLAALGALNSLPFTDGVVFELGGGSLEVIYVENRSLGKIFHFPLGALKLTKTFGSEDGMRKEVRNYLFSLPSWVVPNMVGSGGNVRSIGRLLMRMDGMKFSHVHGYKVTHEKVKSISKTLWSMNLQEISSLPGIGKERAPTVKAAIVVIEELMSLFDAPSLLVSEFGMREGKVMRGEEQSVAEMRDGWLESMAYFMNVRPPREIRLEAEKLTGSEIAGISAYVSHIFMEVGWDDPFDACYRYLTYSLFPGFQKRDLGIVSLVCKGASSKVRKKDLQRLGVDSKLEKIEAMSKVVKTVVKKFPLGVY